MIERHESRINSIRAAYAWRGAGGAYYYTRRTYFALRDDFATQCVIDGPRACAIIVEARATMADMIGWAARD